MVRKKAAKATRKIVKPRVRKSTLPKVGIHLGLEYESFCELSCIYFAEELMRMGYVAKIERSPSYLLCDPVQHTYVEQLKRSSKQVTQTVSQGVSYTPDFDIFFTERAIGIFCWELGSVEKWDKHLLVVQKVGGLYKACCEVKPDFSRASTTPKSVQSMKWLMQKHGVYCNLFRPNAVFKGLFTPDMYKITEKGTQRILKYPVVSLQQYLTKFNKNGKASGGVPITKRPGKRQLRRV